MPKNDNSGQQGKNDDKKGGNNSNYASEMWDQINKSGQKNEDLGKVEKVEGVTPINPFASPGDIPPAPAAPVASTPPVSPAPLDPPQFGGAVEGGPVEGGPVEDGFIDEEFVEEEFVEAEPVEAEPDLPIGDAVTVEEAKAEAVVDDPEVFKGKDSKVVPLEEEKPEVVDLSVPGQEIDEFKEDFWDILYQAGITKGRMIGFGVFVVVIVLALVLFFNGVFDFGEGPVGETVNGEEAVGAEENQPNEKVASDAFGIVSAYIFGEEFKSADTPIEALPVGTWGDGSSIDRSLEIGGIEADLTNRFVHYLELLRNLQNIYSTDIYQMLDVSVDRRVALDNYLKLMSDKIVEAEVAYNDINSLLGQLDSEFQQVVVEKNIREDSFFVNTQGLKAVSAFDDLEGFKALTQESSEIKASFNAYKLLGTMYLNSLQALRPRYHDVVVNSEAVVKGVRIFDVPGSNIDAIIRLSK